MIAVPVLAANIAAICKLFPYELNDTNSFFLIV